MPRVVLVEVTTPPRLHSNLSFPFVKGYLEGIGVTTRWLRFTYHPSVALEAGSAGAAFPIGDLERLTTALREENASHVLLGVIPGEPLLEALRRDASDCVAGVMAGEAQSLAHELGVASVGTDVAELRRWLGLDATEDEDQPVESAGTPSYAWEPGNDSAAEVEQPPVFVHVSPECSYRAPLAESSFWGEAAKDVELPQRWGCTFCTNASFDSAEGRPRNLPLRDELKRQLSAIFSTYPRELTGRLRVRLNGSRISLSPMELVAVVDELDAPACRFLFDYRADYLVSRESAIRRAIEALSQKGHRFEIVLMGLESFSLEQLDRYHKGYTPEVNLRAIRILRTLEREFGEHFSYREHGGLSTVMFDPWCTLGDVALNIAVCRLLRLEGELGKLLTSRLRLYDCLPAAAIARRDGLLVDHYDDPLLDTARRNFYADELPWRFREPRLESVNRLLTRLELEPGAPVDALAASLVALAERSGRKPLDLAARIVREAMANEQPMSPEQIVKAIGEADDEKGPSMDDHDRGLLKISPFGVMPDFAAFKAGLKPVIKVEGRRDEVLDFMVESVKALHDDVIVLRRERSDDYQWSSDQSDAEFFVSRSEDAAREAMDLTAQLESLKLEDEGDAYVEAVARVGELLGYPPCCARAYAEKEADYRGRYEWLRLLRRLEKPGIIPEEMGPHAVSFIPCRLDCPDALAFARKTREVLRSERRKDLRVHPELGGASLLRLSEETPDKLEQAVEAALDRRRSRETLPALRFFDDEGRFALFESDSDIAESYRTVMGVRVYRFPYRFVSGNLDDEQLRALKEGDELEIAPGMIRVWKNGVERWAFTLEAYVWYGGRAFHPAFWRELVESPTLGWRSVVEQVADEVAPSSALPSPRDEHADAREAVVASLKRVATLLQQRKPALLAGYAFASIGDEATGEGWGRVSLHLANDVDERYIVHVVPHQASARRLCETRRFAAYHDADTPAETKALQRLTEVVLRSLERVHPSEEPA